MAEELLKLKGVTRRVTSEFYIRDIELTVYKGEVLALAGKNAAGKSTLTGLINGTLPAESGRIFFEGREVKIAEPKDAVELGIVTLVQNNTGFPQFSVAENILFGNPKYYKTANLTRKRLCEICLPCFAALGIKLDPMGDYDALTPAQKQMADIARAYLFEAKLIIMDEPSSRLPESECETLYDMVKKLRQGGVSIIYITHRLHEIIELADRVAFIEHGEIKDVRAAAGMTELDLIEGVEGHSVNDIYGREPNEPGEPVLELSHVKSEVLDDVSLTVCGGEVLALLCGAESSGAGLYRVLLGLAPYSGGIKVCGADVNIKNPLIADSLRISAAVDESTERCLQSYNSTGGSKTGGGALLVARCKEYTEAMGRMFSKVVVPGALRRGEYMTGGYRQRELVARAMARDADIYILVDATNGIDLQAKMQVYTKLNKLAKRGCAVLYFTNDISEALGLADKIIVLGKNTVVFDTYAKETDADTLKKLLKV